MPELLHRELTERIIGVYYDVYNGLSHAYPESIYENAMMRDLGRQQMRCARQQEYQIFYKEKLVGKQQLDIFVAEEVVVEIKAKPRLTPLDKAQTISYLKTTGKQVGLLFNFGNTEPEFKRLFLKAQQDHFNTPEPAGEWPGLLFPELSYQVIGGLFEVYNELGVGFIHRIYANACYQEMLLRGLAAKPLKEMAVLYRGETIGKVKLGHIQIEDKIMLFPVAIQDTNQFQPGNLRHWIERQDIPLGILANFHAERLAPVLMRVKS